MTETIDRPLISPHLTEPEKRAPSRDRITLLYLALCAVLLAPGLMIWARLGLDETTPTGRCLVALDRALQDIAFGRTPRFWLGVAGATVMALLLAYPLRKKYGFGDTLSVATWFHIHTLLGLLGPSLVLYHTGFGTGSTPANVALATMLTVVASGIFGDFAYARLSARLHAGQRRASEHLVEARTLLGRLSSTRGRSSLIEELDALEKGAHSERGSFIRARGKRQRLVETRREIVARAVHLIESQGLEDGWTSAQCSDTAARVRLSLETYFQVLSRHAGRSTWERIAGHWRLLHLPLFSITVIATLVHVYKVWGIDSAQTPALEAVANVGKETQTTSESMASQPPASRLEKPAPTPQPAPFTTRKVTTRIEPPVAAAPLSTAHDEAAALREGPRLVREAPMPAMPRSSPTSEQSVTNLPPSGPAPLHKPPTPPERAATSGVEPQESQEPAKRDVVSELADRLTRWDNTGTLDAAIVRERLAILKRDTAFDHGKTRFPLTGKHKPLDCARCHSTTLKDTPRQCIDCHKEDDVHRGRRKDCARCHVADDWGIIRRR